MAHFGQRLSPKSPSILAVAAGLWEAPPKRTEEAWACKQGALGKSQGEAGFDDLSRSALNVQSLSLSVQTPNTARPCTRSLLDKTLS